jgi:hypothetical protein
MEEVRAAVKGHIQDVFGVELVMMELSELNNVS